MRLRGTWTSVMGVSLLCWTGPGMARDSEQPDNKVHAFRSSAPLAHRWTADDNLRRYMMPLHVLAQDHLAVAGHPPVTHADYRRWGSAAERQVATVIAHCDLRPAPDEVLHGILAEVLQGAAAMEGRTAETPRQGANRLVEALNRYGVLFDHPGWGTIEIP